MILKDISFKKKSAPFLPLNIIGYSFSIANYGPTNSRKMYMSYFPAPSSFSLK